jgi:maltose alpha-D-glucosyltransferase/alpha-amylase
MEQQLSQVQAPKPPEEAWYQSAVFYQLIIRTFQDSNGDGIGDFQGLISRLPYIQSLGVTTIWLNPFYPSPLNDDGYDVADYCNIHPDLGTLKDFDEFIKKAHELKLRVIIDLVLNHTSDQHPWFQAARKDPQGPAGQFYVWSDTTDKYNGVQINFIDYETSNWAYDEKAKMYYWHRFYSSQPDLNYENPAVHEAMLNTVRFWLDRGIDGFRCDAVPYLYEEEGTTCENLPKTHQFLKKVRSVCKEYSPDIMLLAESAMHPKELIEYFGNGEDEFNLAFHFPLMKAMFVSMATENKWAITGILKTIPPIPSACQWMLFLRNHDELTISNMDKELQEFLFNVYAPEKNMRFGNGIRRRLSPLAKSQKKLLAFNNLLLTLPGTPILYYGDEIGLGENLKLGDRYPVRTPMQWDSSETAGFSTKKDAKFVSWIPQDNHFSPKQVNVQDQENNPESLLNQLRALIKKRGNYVKIFGSPFYEVIEHNQEGLLAFKRWDHDPQQSLLILQNLTSQSISFTLPYEFGDNVLELVSERTLDEIVTQNQIKLGPFEFAWLKNY